MDDNPDLYCRYRHGLKDIYARKQQIFGDEFKPEIWWLSGPTGCGKTRSAKEYFKGACILHCCPDMWFDEYDGADTIIFDEFRHNSIEY